MLRLKVVRKKQKPIFIAISSRQEGHQLAKGLFKGDKCKIIDQGRYANERGKISTMYDLPQYQRKLGY
jgi:hypothetical protein